MEGIFLVFFVIFKLVVFMNILFAVFFFIIFVFFVIILIFVKFVYFFIDIVIFFKLFMENFFLIIKEMVIYFGLSFVIVKLFIVLYIVSFLIFFFLKKYGFIINEFVDILIFILFKENIVELLVFFNILELNIGLKRLLISLYVCFLLLLCFL